MASLVFQAQRMLGDGSKHCDPLSVILIAQHGLEAQHIHSFYSSTHLFILKHALFRRSRVK